MATHPDDPDLELRSGVPPPGTPVATIWTIRAQLTEAGEHVAPFELHTNRMGLDPATRQKVLWFDQRVPRFESLETARASLPAGASCLPPDAQRESDVTAVEAWTDLSHRRGAPDKYAWLELPS